MFSKNDLFSVKHKYWQSSTELPPPIHLNIKHECLTIHVNKYLCIFFLKDDSIVSRWILRGKLF